MKIHPKQCSNAIGEEGTCMFVWECIKTEGRHLGTCVDGFLFGSCCGHNDSFNTLEPGFDTSSESVLPTQITLTNTKDRPKNKWKPSSTLAPLTSTAAPPLRRTTLRTTVRTKPTTVTTTTTTTTTSAPLKNVTHSLWAPVPPVPRPTSSPRPWYISSGTLGNNALYLITFACQSKHSLGF